MKLYKGQLIGTARPSQEIEEIRWLDIQEPKEILIASLVLNHILPLAAQFPLISRAFSQLKSLLQVRVL